MLKLFKKFGLLMFIISFLLDSCLYKEMPSEKIYDHNSNRIYQLDYFKKSEVIVPKNQTDSQSLSIIVKNSDGKLIVFDGGRQEDSDYLVSIIKANGGVVAAWFLTHIHDDHIGALYKILSDKEYGICINNLFYNFADFDWYYKQMGNDAGILNIFEEAIKNYNSELTTDSKNYINVQKKLGKGEIFNYNNVEIEVLNNMFKLDSDPINNTSIVFRVEIENKSMIVFGDLGYKGGVTLLDNVDLKKLKCDICVLAHHGQNGVPMTVYYLADPEIVIWPTSKTVYENANGKFDTDTTKNHFKDYPCKLQILSYVETSIIK